jgi:hypothetical protein
MSSYIFWKYFGAAEMRGELALLSKPSSTHHSQVTVFLFLIWVSLAVALENLRSLEKVVRSINLNSEERTHHFSSGATLVESAHA